MGSTPKNVRRVATAVGSDFSDEALYDGSRVHELSMYLLASGHTTRIIRDEVRKYANVFRRENTRLGNKRVRRTRSSDGMKPDPGRYPIKAKDYG